MDPRGSQARKTNVHGLICVDKCHVGPNRRSAQLGRDAGRSEAQDIAACPKCNFSDEASREIVKVPLKEQGVEFRFLSLLVGLEHRSRKRVIAAGAAEKVDDDVWCGAPTGAKEFGECASMVVVKRPA